MFKRSLNRAVVHVKLSTVSPLLIRAGDTGLDPSQADLCAVRTHHGHFGETVYIPGSSLKGVVRSAAEALVRLDGNNNGRDGLGACDPLDHKTSCGGRQKRGDQATAAVYAAHCLACRTFGSTAMKGRISIRDLFPWPGDGRELDVEQRRNAAKANALEGRHGVAIDRIMGSVKIGPFDLEMVPAGVAFFGEIALENFQAWQLGMLACALDELRQGFAQLGSTKSRGLGVVRPTIERIVYEQTAQAGEVPKGIGLLDSEAALRQYALKKDRDLPSAVGEVRGLSRRFVIEGESADKWLDSAITAMRDIS
jgi:CRISPR-associated protein Csm3